MEFVFCLVCFSLMKFSFRVNIVLRTADSYHLAQKLGSIHGYKSIYTLLSGENLRLVLNLEKGIRSCALLVSVGEESIPRTTHPNLTVQMAHA